MVNALKCLIKKKWFTDGKYTIVVEKKWFTECERTKVVDKKWFTDGKCTIVIKAAEREDIMVNYCENGK